MDVAAWLQGLGLERYVPAFRDNDVDAEVSWMGEGASTAVGWALESSSHETRRWRRQDSNPRSPERQARSKPAR
jgi:hypothetical protein